MKTISIKSCRDPFEANVVKGRLENEGIPCFLTNENLTTLLPHHFMWDSSGVHVFVDEDDVERALEVLAEDAED